MVKGLCVIPKSLDDVDPLRAGSLTLAAGDAVRTLALAGCPEVVSALPGFQIFKHLRPKSWVHTCMKAGALLCMAPVRYHLTGIHSSKPARSLMTSPAMISPATEGTKAILPGVALRGLLFPVSGTSSVP